MPWWFSYKLTMSSLNHRECLRGAGSCNLLLSKNPKVSSGLLNKTRMDAKEGRI